MARILVVDDESNIRLMIKLALTASGHEVEGAPDGNEGLEKFGDGTHYDLVLLDQRMPGLQGLEVLRAMKAKAPKARIIMITAFGTVDLATEAMTSGATDFLRKPFTTEILRGAVESALHDAEPPAAHVPGGSADLTHAAINGFRLQSDEPAPECAPDGSLSHHFTVQTPERTFVPCTVVLPPFLIELVKAHADREDLEKDEDFWRWLSEEALANYHWQNAALPPNQTLVVDELTSNLRRWMDAVLAN